MFCTVVSLYPLDIKNEEKPGLYPGTFNIPKSDGKTPSVIHVEHSNCYVYLDWERGSLRTLQPADEVARSICEDFSRSVLGYEVNTNSPALFWVEGQLEPAEVLKKYPEKVEEALRLQRNWFTYLVKTADDEWNKTKQLRAISNLQRFAANFLNLEREWNVEAAANLSKRCPACTEIIHTDAAVCPNCSVILDEARYNKFKFAGALVNK